MYTEYKHQSQQLMDAHTSVTTALPTVPNKNWVQVKIITASTSLSR